MVCFICNWCSLISKCSIFLWIKTLSIGAFTLHRKVHCFLIWEHLICLNCSSIRWCTSTFVKTRKIIGYVIWLIWLKLEWSAIIQLIIRLWFLITLFWILIVIICIHVLLYFWKIDLYFKSYFNLKIWTIYIIKYFT